MVSTSHRPLLWVAWRGFLAVTTPHFSHGEHCGRPGTLHF